jgi:selenocysteine lyase/cysteine desulfurase
MSLDRRSFVATAAALAASAAVRPARAIAMSATVIGGEPDPLGVRSDFPICADCTYLNSAYIAPIPRPVVAAGNAYLELKANRPIDVFKDLLSVDDTVRAQFARLVNATPDEIGLLFSTGEGENVIANGLDLKAGDNVVLSGLNYPIPFLVYRNLEATRGIELRIAKHRNGVVDLSDFEPLVDKRTRVISVAWVSHMNGFRHDMRPIADLAHAHGAVLHADAVQAVGMFPIDVHAAGVDSLCSGTYKWLLAGFGVAPFYIRPELMERLRLDRFGEFQIVRELPEHRFELKKTASRFDYDSRAFGAVFQLGASLTYLEKVGVASIEQHTVGLAQRLYDGLTKQGYRMFTPPGNRSSIVTLHATKPMEDVGAAFRAANIEVSVEDNRNQPQEYGNVRISTALFNTQDEVDKCLEVTRRLA